MAQQTLFQSGWFVVGLLTQTLIVHMIRTPKIPFIQSRAAAPLLVMTLADHGHRHLPADGAAGRTTSSCRRCRRCTSCSLPVILLGYMATDAGDEGVLHPPLRLAVRSRHRGGTDRNCRAQTRRRNVGSQGLRWPGITDRWIARPFLPLDLFWTATAKQLMQALPVVEPIHGVLDGHAATVHINRTPVEGDD